MWERFGTTTSHSSPALQQAAIQKEVSCTCLLATIVRLRRTSQRIIFLEMMSELQGSPNVQSQRRSELPKRPKLFVTSLDDADQGIGSSSYQVPKRLGHSSTGTNQTIQKGTRIAKLHILWKHTPRLAPPVILGTPILEQGNLRQKAGESNIHFNAGDQSLSMICKLIESANRLCMFFATVKYMADRWSRHSRSQSKTAQRK